jgi:hypothetical protein
MFALTAGLQFPYSREVYFSEFQALRVVMFDWEATTL